MIFIQEKTMDYGERTMSCASSWNRQSVPFVDGHGATGCMGWWSIRAAVLTAADAAAAVTAVVLTNISKGDAVSFWTQL